MKSFFKLTIGLFYVVYLSACIPSYQHIPYDISRTDLTQEEAKNKWLSVLSKTEPYQPFNNWKRDAAWRGSQIVNNMNGTKSFVFLWEREIPLFRNDFPMIVLNVNDQKKIKTTKTINQKTGEVVGYRAHLGESNILYANCSRAPNITDSEISFNAYNGKNEEKYWVGFIPFENEEDLVEFVSATEAAFNFKD